MAINLLRLGISFFVNVVVDYKKSPIFILSIIHFITFFSSQLDSLAGILIFLICKSNIHKMKQKIRMSLELEKRRSLSWSTFSTVSIPILRSQITSSELESSFRSMLLMHGLQLSNPVFHGFSAIRARSEQTPIRDWQMQWRRIQIPMESISVNISFFLLPFLAVLDT